ncbi:hypothetical protein VOLCADRAFT_117025 [Volvox carteri f. nagariensis]|uniref:FAD-binding domain-containing protein n=1 Tax=Volvox carteri f. nagariensis TaxID=3068 RepID=D8TRL3_VOLCA|nr:uncharacterized protein VOLCADRAFT_117025 [Volvox carteri f. nagariensis]EFJ50014.1 hypothetical protein VOLCADRAFT_117025 [Volvox carteri f. nagariensis]|eukprot:XP_002949079.1 hypothetical protein VOLCADRAFT_117025 [Volvox carteri f. nagariensis]
MDAPEVEEEEGRRWDPTTLTAVVVGAGPTGALAAHYLAMRGYKVEVYDKGARPSPGDAASVPLVLTSRGAIAFEELGLDGQRRVGPTATPLRGVWDMVGRRLRPLDSSSAFRRTFVTDRSGLAADVIRAAEQRYPNTVRFHFNTELTRAELKNRVAGARPSTSEPADAADVNASAEIDVPYDLLVGADGLESTVRRILKAKVKDFGVIRPVEETAGYRAVSRLPRPSREPLTGFYTHRPQEYVYDWSAPGKPSVRLYIDIDGSVGGLVSGLRRWDDAAAAAAELQAAYPDSFPEEWAAAVGQQVSSPALGEPRHAAILQCSQFYGPRTVLLGDAAHAVTGASGPMGLGQGPSAAVESVRTLALVLRGAQDDLDKVPEVYSNVRGDAVMAMQMLEFMELTRDSERARRLKFASWWFAWSAFVTQGFRWLAETVGGLLSAVMPKTFLSAPQVLARLEDRRIGYSEVIKMLQGYASPVVALLLGAIFVGLFMAFNRALA